MNAWIITTSPAIATLVAHARAVHARVIVVAVGVDPADLGGVDQVITVPLPDGRPAEGAAPQVLAAVAATGDDIVLTANRSADRVLGAAVAAHLAAPMLTNVLHVGTEGIEVSGLGGQLIETIPLGPGPLVLVAEGGSDLARSEVAEVSPAPDVPALPLTVTGTAEAGESTAVDLTAARRVIGVGRGFATVDDLGLAHDLARALNAEVGCSRPLAEGTGWMPSNTYIGVSGQHIAPELYVAVGISGQLQHTVGARAATTVVVINKDPKAPYFAEADYGVVGDLYEVLPALVKALT